LPVGSRTEGILTTPEQRPAQAGTRGQ
jgi:hypothetical protein